MDQEDGGAQYFGCEEVHGQRLHPTFGGGLPLEMDDVDMFFLLH